MDNNKSRFPLWLLCLILFIVLVAAAIHLISAGVNSIPQEPAAAPGEPSSSEMVVPDDAFPLPEETVPADMLTPEGTEADMIMQEDAADDMNTWTVTAEEAAAALDELESSLNAVSEGLHVHHFVNGVCDSCGAKPVFYTDLVPEELLQPAMQEGSVSLHEYTVTNYGNRGVGEVEKCFNVYVPWGYDGSQKYPVLILMHGANDDYDSWLLEEHEYGSGTLSGKALLDRMIELGYCRPCIVVSPAFETRTIQGITAAVYQMRDELREYILPWLTEHYSTYAENNSLEAVAAARDWFALGGLSDGALFVYEGGMRYNFDLFGNYVAFSGNGEPWKTVSAIQSDEWAELPIQCLFTGAGGDTDIQQHYTEIGYDYFIENDSRFRAEENAWHVDVTGGHVWKVWLTGLCNALPLLFP